MSNRSLIKRIWLRKNERPVAVVRRSLANWLWQLTAGFGILILSFFLMFFFLGFGYWGAGAFCLLVAFSVLVIAKSFYEHHFSCWVLTDMRLADFYQRGFFHREFTEAFYDGMSEVYAGKHGIFNYVFGLADISVSLSGSKVRLMLSGVRNSERIVSKIALLRENFFRKR